MTFYVVKSHFYDIKIFDPDCLWPSWMKSQEFKDDFGRLSLIH